MQITDVGCHVRCCANVEEPLSSLCSNRWHTGSGQSQEKRLVVPDIWGGRKGLEDAGRKLGRRTGEICLLRWTIGSGTRDAGIGNTEWHWPSLYHPDPGVDSRDPASERTRHRRGAITAHVLVATTTPARGTVHDPSCCRAVEHGAGGLDPEPELSLLAGGAGGREPPMARRA